MFFNFMNLWINSYIYIFGNYFMICKIIYFINNFLNETNEIRYYECDNIKYYLLLFSNLNIFPYEFYKYYLQNPNELNQLLLEWI